MQLVTVRVDVVKTVEWVCSAMLDSVEDEKEKVKEVLETAALLVAVSLV